MYKCWCYVQVGVERKIEFRWVPSISGYFSVGGGAIYLHDFCTKSGVHRCGFFCELNDSK